MNDIFNDIYNAAKRTEPYVLVTVVDKKGQGPQVIGSKMLVNSNGHTKGTVGGGELETAAVSKSVEIFKSKKSQLQIYDLSGKCTDKISYSANMICGGLITLFFDYLALRPSVYIFGAGHVGRAVADHIKHLDYSITAVDHREGIFSGFDERIQTVTGGYSDVISQLNIPNGSYFVIATYGHEYDYEVLDSLYEKACSPAYIGLLSSKVKVKETVGRLSDKLGRGETFKNLYTPVGLNIGGSAPDEIAIAIIAEMQAVKYNKNELGHLREQWYLEPVS